MKKYVERFHYLTQDLPGRTHLEQVEQACEAGAKWIQYRCFTKSDEELVEELHQIAAVCDDWGTTLILTDHYHLLDQVDAQGVHLEDMDADFSGIRETIGPEKTLGASANTFGQIERIAKSGAVDYVGFGPFAHTDTKPNNYPLLGYGGYASVISQMRQNEIETPVLAVGGVQVGDVEELMATGIYGIAVSAAINQSEDPVGEFKAFYDKLY